MRNAKRRGKRGKSGAEEVIGPVDLALGSARSRAGARMLAEQVGQETGSEPERFQLIFDVPRPRRDPERPHASPWVRHHDGRLFRTVFIPEGMGEEEVARLLDSDE